MKKRKQPTLQQRIFRAIKSGKLGRMPRTPAETMTDFELARFLIENTPDHDLEYYLAATGHGTSVLVSANPPIRAEQFEDIVETLTKLAQKSGGRVGVTGEGLDGAPMDVTLYDGRPRGA